MFKNRFSLSAMRFHNCKQRRKKNRNEKEKRIDGRIKIDILDAITFSSAFAKRE